MQQRNENSIFATNVTPPDFVSCFTVKGIKEKLYNRKSKANPKKTKRQKVDPPPKDIRYKKLWKAFVDEKGNVVQHGGLYMRNPDGISQGMTFILGRFEPKNDD